MPRDLVSIILAAALLAVVIAACLVPLGCAADTSGAGAWSSDYDAPWNEERACWEKATGKTFTGAKPKVTVRGDCVWSIEYCVWYYANAKSETGYATGYYYPTLGRIDVCQDLAALQHEMAHYLSEQLRGVTGSNGEGVCAL